MQEWFHKGQKYSSGLFKNHKKAFECFLKGAEMGEWLSMAELVHAYRDGIGVEKNQAESDRWYATGTKIRDMRNSKNKDTGSSKTDKPAVQTAPAQQAPERIQPLSSNNFEKAHNEALALQKQNKFTESFPIFMELAEAGYAPAQLMISLYFYDGIVVVKSNEESFKWAKKSADQGYVLAQYLVGIKYREGTGTEQNHSEAVKWFNKAAAQGNISSYFILGVCYQEGEGIEQNFAKAAELYKIIAEHGHASAQCNLGLLYQKGYGVEQNYAKAFEWYHKAAEQGETAAQFNIGVCYYFGIGIEKDKKKGLEIINTLAGQGSDQAKEMLDAIKSEKFDKVMKGVDIGLEVINFVLNAAKG
jgi:TPR repeat protein